jgi:predicted regulator of Ras-like GTPase activity (Roadblock/LC7/MglB family)
MAIDTVLDDLKSIKGYRAAGIMTHTGEMLAAHSLDTKINFNVVGATFNDIFRSAHEAAGKVGMGANNETQIVTPSGIIIMVCTGVSSAAHVHMIAIIDKDGNQALARMTMEKMSSKVVAELS